MHLGGIVLVSLGLATASITSFKAISDAADRRQRMDEDAAWARLEAARDQVTDSISPWFFGPVGLVIADVRPTKFVSFKGALGFFEVPDDIVDQAVAP